MNDHERYMRRAITLAENVPDLPFGAVIVDGCNGTILAEGWNKTSLNPMWHGEVDAINGLVSSGVEVEDKSLVLYTTAEPCPMCQGAILWSGIERRCNGLVIVLAVSESNSPSRVKQQ